MINYRNKLPFSSNGWSSGTAEAEERRRHLARQQASRLWDQDRLDRRQSADDGLDVEREVRRQEKVDVDSGQKVEFSYILGFVAQPDSSPEPGKFLFFSNPHV